MTSNYPLFVEHRADYIEAWRMNRHVPNQWNVYRPGQCSRRRIERVSYNWDAYQTMIVTISAFDMTVSIFPRQRQAAPSQPEYPDTLCQDDHEFYSKTGQYAPSQPAPDAHLEAAYDDRFEL